MTDDLNELRCGFVALIGPTNAGKSTLLNQMVGAKISIVTHKVQTTRTMIRAVANYGVSQVIFVDTPGIFKPKRSLDEAMVQAAWTGADDADVLLLLIDAQRGLSDDALAIVRKLKATKRKAVLGLNKIDTIKREDLLALASSFNEEFDFDETFMISALKGDGIQELKSYLTDKMPIGPWHYPEDQLADLPSRLLASEITREKLYLRLHQELPYESTVETENWEQRKDGSIRIDQIVIVSRDGHKGIVVGKKGQTIKAIGKAAREELEEMFETKIHLFLRVLVKENWARDPERYRNMGLDLPKG